MTTLPAILRAEADRLGLSQSQLAERSGLRQSSISEYLSGRKRPSAANLAAMLRGLGRPWGWLDRQGLDPRE